MDNTIAFYEAVIIFAVTYIGIIFDKIPRTICALVGGGMMIYFHHVTQDMAIKEFIDFNTLGLLAGMMVLISIVKQSGFFEAMALWAVKESRGKALWACLSWLADWKRRESLKRWQRKGLRW